MLNYFELFAMPVSFELDLQRLSHNYQELQKLTHPDRFAGESGQQQRLAIQKNSQVNDGFQILKSPIGRAEHLLALRGIELANETQTMQDMGFLMQQMQWRELLEESSDSDDPQSVIDELIDEVASTEQAINSNILLHLELNTDEANHAVAEDVRKLKFIDKMNTEISEQEEKLFN